MTWLAFARFLRAIPGYLYAGLAVIVAGLALQAKANHYKRKAKKMERRAKSSEARESIRKTVDLESKKAIKEARERHDRALEEFRKTRRYFSNPDNRKL